MGHHIQIVAQLVQRLQIILLQQLGPDVVHDDAQLVLLVIRRQFDNVQAVFEDRRKYIQIIGRGNKNGIGQVDREAQEIINKAAAVAVQQVEQNIFGAAMLLRAAHLIDLVQQDDRAETARTDDRFDDTAVVSIAEDLLYAAQEVGIGYTGQRDLDTGATHGAGDGQSDGGLANTRRSGQQQNSTVAAAQMLLTGHIAHDLLLDPFHSIMGTVEGAFGHTEVNDIGGLLCQPGQAEHGAEVVFLNIFLLHIQQVILHLCGHGRKDLFGDAALEAIFQKSVFGCHFFRHWGMLLSPIGSFLHFITSSVRCKSLSYFCTNPIYNSSHLWYTCYNYRHLIGCLSVNHS